MNSLKSSIYSTGNECEWSNTKSINIFCKYSGQFLTVWAVNWLKFCDSVSKWIPTWGTDKASPQQNKKKLNGKSGSIILKGQSKNSTRKRNFKSKWTCYLCVETSDFRSIEWHQKTYYEISWDYHFNPLPATRTLEYVHACFFEPVLWCSC
jgi:hypothetical protein